MKIYLSRFLHLSRGATARSLYWILSSNGIMIVLTFFTTVFIANSLSKSENGIFLALFTLANLLSDFGEFGLGGGLTNFIPPLINEGKHILAKKYVSFTAQIELGIAIIITAVLFMTSPFLSRVLFDATPVVHVWVNSLMTGILVVFGFSIFVLSAYRQFREVAAVNALYSIVRLALIVVLMMMHKLTLLTTLIAYTLAFGIGWLYSLIYVGPKINLKPEPFEHARKLFKFSSLLGLQKLFVSVSSRLDLIMLIPLSNALEAGIYGIGSRFGLIYPVIIASLGQVIAPRFAEYKNSKDAFSFFKNVSIIIFLLLCTQIVFFIIAQPMIDLLVPKYHDAIPVFQALLVALTGFVIATPFTSFLIYTARKPQITTFASGVQLLIVFVANWIAIPHYGRFGPIIGIGIGNLAVAIIAIGGTIWTFRKEK